MKRVLTFLVLLAACALARCTQGEGEPCQIDDDCNGELTCCGASQGAVRGYCSAMCRNESEEDEDSGVSNEEAGSMSTPPADASQQDANQSDASEPDAG